MAQLSPRDFDLLSAYMDGQISARDLAAVEKRLKDDPEARQALAELRQMRAALRALPARKVPHHFTLTRSMAQAQRMPRAIPLLRFSSVLSALVMAFLFVLQLGPRLMPTAMAPAPVMESYAAEDASSKEAENSPIIIWNQGPTGGGGGMGGAPAGMGGAAEGYAMAGAPEIPADSTAKIAPEATPAADVSALPTAAPAPLAAGENTSVNPSILGINTDQAGQRIYDDSATPRREDKNPLSAFVWAQIALGAAALGFGLAAITLTRRFRRG